MLNIIEAAEDSEAALRTNGTQFFGQGFLQSIAGDLKRLVLVATADFQSIAVPAKAKVTLPWRQSAARVTPYASTAISHITARQAACVRSRAPSLATMFCW